jgi:NADP-dependent 3-hydroxy acid dehydrogenase YdfG
MDRKIIVITGASEGIGAALAKQLGKKGHKLALAARREPELKKVALEASSESIAVVCDVTRRENMENLRDAAIERFGGVDVWVNNVGRGIGRTVLQLSEEDFDEMVDVNLKSAFYGMQTIVPYFQEQKKGHLINISSFLARVPFATFRSIYSAAKAALNSLTANLRMDLAAEFPDIHVSLVMPGVVTTGFSKNALGGTPQVIRRGGMAKPQNAEEVASVIADVIENPKAEVYTNPALGELAQQYISDVAEFEQRLRQA